MPDQSKPFAANTSKPASVPPQPVDIMAQLASRGFGGGQRAPLPQNYGPGSPGYKGPDALPQGGFPDGYKGPGSFTSDTNRAQPNNYNGNPRGAFNMPGSPGWNPNQPMRGRQQAGMEGFIQDASGRMTPRLMGQQRQLGFPQRGQQGSAPVMDNQFSGQGSGYPVPDMNPYYGTRGGGNNYPPSQGYMGGQFSNAGRYRPPTMDGSQNWNDYGGYNYNLPNAFTDWMGGSTFGNPYSSQYGGYGSGMGYGYSRGGYDQNYPPPLPGRG